MDPVDPRAPLRRVPRPRRPENEHRHPVAPRVEDRHAAVQQADVRVQDGAHHAPARFGVAVRHRHRALLVQAEQHLRTLVADVIHEAVVQPAEARTGHQGDPGHVEGLEHASDRVARPELVAGSRWLGRLGQDRRLHRVRSACLAGVRSRSGSGAGRSAGAASPVSLLRPNTAPQGHRPVARPFS